MSSLETISLNLLILSEIKTRIFRKTIHKLFSNVSLSVPESHIRYGGQIWRVCTGWFYITKTKHMRQLTYKEKEYIVAHGFRSSHPRSGRLPHCLGPFGSAG